MAGSLCVRECGPAGGGASGRASERAAGGREVGRGAGVPEGVLQLLVTVFFKLLAHPLSPSLCSISPPPPSICAWSRIATIKLTVSVNYGNGYTTRVTSCINVKSVARVHV